MSLDKYQKEVDDWIQLHKIKYFGPFETLARLTEETGELAREINHTFGPKKKKATEEDNEISNELGDILFTIICIANSQGINLDDSFKHAMDKCYGRDKNRYEKE